jgi:hypothetical protein
VSRLCDRVTRRASPGLDTDLSGLGLGFIYPGNVRFSGNTLIGVCMCCYDEAENE